MKPLKSYWAVFSKSGHVWSPSIAYQRKESIKRFLQDSNETWDQVRKEGFWRVVKVDVIFKEVR